MPAPVSCPTFGPALVSTWNLNALGISAGLDVQGNQLASPVAPLNSIWFTAATTGSVANDHGILVNLDPQANILRLWDLDTRLGVATGVGLNFLAQDSGALWASSAVPLVHRLDPLARGQWTWTLPVDPFSNTLRGITVMPDGSLMISLSNNSGVPGSLRNLNPTTDTLVGFDLPTETAPFGGSLAPDGTFFFCEFETNRIARLDLTTLTLTEWQLPDNEHPFRLFVDPLGIVWFVDQARVGRLDPVQSTVSFFAKDGVLPQDVAPVVLTSPSDGNLGDLPPLFVVADGNAFIDVLCASPILVTPVPTITSALTQKLTLVTPAPSRPVLTTVELIPGISAVAPVEPPQFSRYAVDTPTLAATQHLGVLYAIGNEFQSSTFRAYRLDLRCSVIGDEGRTGGNTLGACSWVRERIVPDLENTTEKAGPATEHPSKEQHTETSMESRQVWTMATSAAPAPSVVKRTTILKNG